MFKTMFPESIMKYGKYKGMMMRNVPAQYLLWGFVNDRVRPEVAFYVNRYLEEIKERMLDEMVIDKK